jgi:hypothetical protein
VLDPNRPIREADIVRAIYSVHTRHVTQRLATFDGVSFASELNGASHPIGMPPRVAGATKSSRSPLRDRSTMPSWVIGVDCAVTMVRDGAASSIVTEFIARTTTAAPANVTMRYFVLLLISWPTP